MAGSLETKEHTEVGINGFLEKARRCKLTPNRAGEQLNRTELALEGVQV
jgi:hypothetical protein